MIAIAVAEPGTIKRWATEKGLATDDLHPYLSNDDLLKTIVGDFNRLAVENKFNSLEKIKQLYLTLEPFTQENDILTPTMKIKRNIAKKIYETEIAELYTKPMIN